MNSAVEMIPDNQTSNDDVTIRTLPHNLEAEQAILGAILEDNRIIEDFSDYLRPNHFFVPVHQRIYDSVLKIIERGQNADAIALKAYFEKDEELKDVGGAEYIGDLAGSVISIINAKNYAQIIYDLYLRRELVAIGRDVVNDAFEQDIDASVDDCLQGAEKRLYDLAESGGNSGGFITMKDAVNISIQMAEKAFKTEGHVTGVTTGLRDFDKRLGGLQPSDLLILAARPAMGKTSLAVNIAYNAANAYAKSGGDEGGRVGVISLEMSSDQLATRLLSSLSGIPSEKMRTGSFNAEDFYRMVDVSGWLAQIPLYIDDTPAQTITAVRTRARRMKRKHGLDLLIVDYLQLLRGSGSKQGNENRVLEVSEITRGLKAIAKELEIPVMALSQLSRGVESRDDKRPMLSDLRESGSIEQDADVVMFIYREEYYLQAQEPDQGDSTKHAEWEDKMAKAKSIAQVIIAKQRHGSTGVVDLRFDGQFTRFEDLDKYHSEQL